MASRLESLPDEVLLAVLGRLGDGDLARFRLLSGRMRAVARSARWEVVSAEARGATAPDLDALVRAIERGAFSRVGRLIVRRDGDGLGALRVLHAAAASRTDVRTLALHAEDAVGLLAALQILAAAPLRPRRLELAVEGYVGSFGALAASFAGALPSVVELDLRAARGLSPDALAELFGATPGVESLSVEAATSSGESWYHPPPSSPFRALEALPRIASLRIRDPRWFAAVGAGAAAVPTRAPLALLHLDFHAAGRQLERAAGLARRTTRVRALIVDPEGLDAILGVPGLEIERELEIRNFRADAAGAARALALARWIPSVRFGFGASLCILCPLHIDSILAIAAAARDAIDRNPMIHYGTHRSTCSCLNRTFRKYRRAGIA